MNNATKSDSFEQAGFIVIGNFLMKTDGDIETTFNFASGISDQNFNFLMKSEAENHGLSVTYEGDGTIVLKGTESQMRQIRSANGTRFSYYFSHDEDAVHNMMLADQEYVPIHDHTAPKDRSRHDAIYGSLDA